MKNKFLLFITACLIVFAAGLCFLLLFDEHSYKLDVGAVNDVAMTYYENGDVEKAFEKAEKYGFSVTILDKDENVVDKLGNACENKAAAFSERETVLELGNGCTVIISDDFSTIFSKYRSTLILVFCICVGLVFCMMIFYCWYIYYRVVKPFDKLRLFAARVAQGNLDCPLEMDRENLFGAFTESFDIMRVELAASREREYKANQSKKELIASLSHDIKTPVASIRATAELVEIMSENDKVKNKLQGIQQKADQIELLINNLFHATLEELQELEVKDTEENSQLIDELIRLADFSGLVGDFTVPECILKCDKLRLGQVFDNIISNSYKYAGTPISVSCQLEGDFMHIEILDSGKSLDEDDISRCLDKFYRGKNSEGKNGSGLGLYISSYFCDKMGGALEVSSKDGFCVTVTIPLAK